MISATIGEFVYCFVDTNVLLQFETFDEVDWPTAVSSMQVCLVLAPVVGAELNDHKDDASNERLNKRARLLLSKLKTRLQDAKPGEQVPVRSGVTLMDIPREPSAGFDWARYGLDRSNNDDRLIASMLEFIAEHQNSVVVLITDDFPAKRKAQAQGLQVLDAEGALTRLAPPSPASAELQRLRDEVRVLRSQIPDLHLDFWESGNASSRIDRTLNVPKPSGHVQTDEEIEELIGNKRAELETTIAARQSRSAKSDLEEYARQFEKYLSRLRLSLKVKRARTSGQRIEVQFVLQNLGSIPAADVQVEILFPSGTYLVNSLREELIMNAEEDFVGEPRPPWKGVSNPLYAGIPASLISPTRSELPRPKPEITGPEFRTSNRHVAHFSNIKVRHHDNWRLPNLVAYLPQGVRGGCEVSYSIKADNIPEPVSGKLAIVLNRPTSPSEPSGQDKS